MQRQFARRLLGPRCAGPHGSTVPTLGFLAAEVQLRRVFQTQDDRTRHHSLLRLLPVRGHPIPPVEAPIVEEAMRRHGLAPAQAGNEKPTDGVGFFRSIQAIKLMSEKRANPGTYRSQYCSDICIRPSIPLKAKSSLR
jgi:hypothetical protein